MGYTLFKSVVTKPRRPEKIGYQKHMLIFDHPSLDLKEERIQLMLVNSHDGSTSLRIMLGVYRVVCSNGLIIGKTINERRVLHRGADFLPKVYAAISDIIGETNKLADVISAMKSRVLSGAEKIKFFNDVAIHRLGNDAAASVDYFTFTPRRVADVGNDLYRVFNVAQEVLINGSIVYINEGKSRVTRRLKGIDAVVDANKFVWDRATSLLAA